MKQIPLLQGKALLVELPEGLGEYNMFLWDAYYDVTGDFHEAPSLTSTHKDPDKTRILLPEGNWRIIGMLSELTEAEARQIARHRKHNTIRDGKLAEWLMFYNHTTNIYGQATALESLESAIFAEGYYLDENPIPEPDISRYPNDDWIADYNNAQSRVLDRSRCLLLGREI